MYYKITMGLVLVITFAVYYLMMKVRKKNNMKIVWRNGYKNEEIPWSIVVGGTEYLLKCADRSWIYYQKKKVRLFRNAEAGSLNQLMNLLIGIAIFLGAILVGCITFILLEPILLSQTIY